MIGRGLSLVVLMALLTPLTVSAEREWPKYGVMSLEDFQAYFRPGNYLAFMDELQITRRDTLISVDWYEEEDGTHFSSTWSVLGVAENLLRDGDAPFAKTKGLPSEMTMVWQPSSRSFGFEISADEFDDEPDLSRVWLSLNDDPAISPNDVEYGSSEDYFDEAYEQTDGACCLSDDEYREVSIGAFRFNCSFVAHKTWEVMCIDRHVATGYTWRTFYARLDDSIG